MSETENKITFEEFSKVELKVGKILRAENLPGYKKILRLIVDLGGEEKRESCLDWPSITSQRK